MVFNYSADYQQQKILKKGSLSTVAIAVDKRTSQQYAIKSIHADTDPMVTRVQREIGMLMSMNHPNIMTLRGYFADKDDHHLVMAFMKRGDLFDVLAQSTFSEKLTQKISFEMMSAINYLHNKMGIVHRDLKPENILLDERGSVKLTDFGHSKMIEQGEYLISTCGSSPYMAPERLKKLPYGRASDVWSAGLIIFIMLHGVHPFQDDQGINVVRIMKGRRLETPCMWKKKSVEALNAVNSMIQVDPAERGASHDIIESRWFLKQQQSNRSQGYCPRA